MYLLACMSVCMHAVPILDPLELKSAGIWTLGTGPNPLDEKPVLLTAESPPSSLKSFYLLVCLYPSMLCVCEL